MAGYIFRNSKGQFSKPSKRGQVYTQTGAKVYGKRKNTIIEKAQKQRRVKPRTRPRSKVKTQTGAISGAVPKDLTSSFAWFTENSDKANPRQVRPTYAILRLSQKSTYRQEKDFKKNYLIPFRLPRGTVKKNKARTSEEIINLARRSGIDHVAEVKAVVVKKSDKAIKATKHRNPLLSESQRKKLESEWRKANRKKYDL